MTFAPAARRCRRFALPRLALALGAGVLAAACGGDGGSTPSAPPPATPAPAPAPPPPPPPPTCTVGLVLRAGDSCTYPGTSETLTVNADGSATFSSVTSDASINISTDSLTLVATRQSDGSWIVERVGADSLNRAPVAIGNIRDQVLQEGGEATTLDVSSSFLDADGDALTYAAVSSQPIVVRVTVSGSQLTLTPEAAGSAAVTVTATDPGGQSATQRFDVTVTEDLGATTDTFRAGDRIPDFPTGIPNRTSGANFSLSGGRVLITMGRGGYVQYRDVRYTCNAPRCGIEDGLVTEGEIVRTTEGASGGEPPGDDDGCAIEDLGTLRGTTPTTRTGTLDRDCASPNETGKLARYFSFTLSEAGAVQIDLESSDFDPLLFLREGSDVTGRQLARDDDGGSGTNARLTRNLSPGTYTIEATSFRRDSRGRFTLRVMRTAGGEASGDALELVGELNCSVRDAGIPGSRLANGSISGRFRALRNVTNVIVNGSFIERDGARSTHSLIPDFLGSIDAGDTASFSLAGSFTTSATRFGCEVYVEWTEIRRGATGSLKLAAPRSTVRSPRN